MNNKKLINRILIWKYLTFFGILTTVSIWIYYSFREQFTLENVALEIFYSVITAIILSLFYDVFTRGDNNLLQKEELLVTKETISNNFLSYIDYESLSASIKKKFIEKLYQEDDFIKGLSDHIGSESGYELFYSIFKPLRDGNLLYNVDIENLFRNSGNENSYILEFKQKFKIQKNKKDFFVFFSCDNNIFNTVFYSKHCEIDAAVGVSQSEWHKIKNSIDGMYLKGERIKNGQKEIVRLKVRELKKSELSKRFPIDGLNQEFIRAFCYALPEEYSEYQFEFYYEVENSLLDPYYYWVAENPMYVNNIIINYEHIKNSVGNVSANCVMGNFLLEQVHDKKKGKFTVRVNSLIWPGNGALIVWRPKV